MSTSIFTKKNASPVQTRRAPTTNEDTISGSQRAANRRSLSGKFRSLFRKNSASPQRSTSNDGRPPSAPSRPRSPSPESSRAPTDAPHLRAPTVKWTFGKKSKLPTTPSPPTSTKNKSKAIRKKKQRAAVPMEISNPIPEPVHQISTYDQHGIRRTPDHSRIGTERMSVSSTYDGTETRGFRDYMVIDQSRQYEQEITSNGNSFKRTSTTFEHGRSPSLGRQRLPDTNIEYNYHYDRSPPPLSNLDMNIKPPGLHGGDMTVPVGTTQILASKAPLLPPNPTISSPTLYHTELRRTGSPSMDVDAPRLTAPSLYYDDTSRKNKSKRIESKSRVNGNYGSSSTVDHMIVQNPLDPTRSKTDRTRPLPDAEMMTNGVRMGLSKPNKTAANAKYPYLSAIVDHHLRPAPLHYQDRPSMSSTSLGRPQRFEVSTTTTSDDYNQRQSWPPAPTAESLSLSTTALAPHDGYIRPLTPQKSLPSLDSNTFQSDLNGLRGRSPPAQPRLPHITSTEHPATYRSSTTIYTKDKHQYVDGGEIRTWSVRENGNAHDSDNQRKLSITIPVERTRDQHPDRYEYQVVPSKVTQLRDDDRYAYSSKQRDEHSRIDEQYQATYEYDRQQLASDVRRYSDEFQLNNHYPDQVVSATHANVIPRTQLLSNNEREKIYDRASRLLTESERTQEPFRTLSPAETVQLAPRQFTLKRTDAYDGLGLLISADAETRLNHRIREVELSSPADQAGLRKNDRIIAVNGVNVENVEFSDVLILIKQGLQNDSLQFVVVNELTLI